MVSFIHNFLVDKNIEVMKLFFARSRTKRAVGLAIKGQYLSSLW